MNSLAQSQIIGAGANVTVVISAVVAASAFFIRTEVKDLTQEQSQQLASQLNSQSQQLNSQSQQLASQLISQSQQLNSQSQQLSSQLLSTNVFGILAVAVVLVSLIFTILKK